MSDTDLLIKLTVFIQNKRRQACRITTSGSELRAKLEGQVQELEVMRSRLEQMVAEDETLNATVPQTTLKR